MMTPSEVDRAVSRVIPLGTQVDALQVVMIGPDAVEVKARVAADHQWYQGIVQRRDWEDTAELTHARIQAVRDFCADQITHDDLPSGGLTNRAWCAQSVLNILNGLTDWQLKGAK